MNMSTIIRAALICAACNIPAVRKYVVLWDIQLMFKMFASIYNIIIW